MEIEKDNMGEKRAYIVRKPGGDRKKAEAGAGRSESRDTAYGGSV